MSRRHRSTPSATVVALRPPSLPLLAAALFCVALAALIAGTLAGRVMADPPDGVTRYSAEEAEPAGVGVDVRVTPVGDEEVVEIEAASDELLLDVTHGARLIAAAEGLGPETGAISIRHADGAIVRTEIHGLIDAAFARDASWLALIDGHGSLLRLDVSTGTADMLAEGPFTGPIHFTRDGSLLLRAVSSLHAPFISELTRLNPATGEAAVLSGDELVYAGFELDDGSIAYAAHVRGEGTAVMRAGRNGPRRIADLGVGATEVDVSGDGSIAFTIGEDGVYLIAPAGSAPRRIGAGRNPRFSPDGGELLVHEGGGSLVIGIDGSTLAWVDSPDAAWACSEGCER